MVNGRTHLVDRHQLLCGVRLVFGQRYKLDVLRRSCLIPERCLDGIEVVRADGDELPSPAEILMQLVLQVDEGLV